MKNKKITYSEVGDNYDTKDPIKILAQTAAKETAQNLIQNGYDEISETRGESAYVWKQGDIFMAAVTEQLGTKNLVADEVGGTHGKTYYDVIGHDTVAAVINDLATVGAKPLVITAFWAIENNDWLQNRKRMNDLIGGWKNACDLAGVSWGGGETPTLKGIIQPGTVALGGSAVGIISGEKKIITDKKLQAGDRILLLKSNGINANGLSLARAVAKKMKNGYGEKLSDGTMYGEAILTKTNIYAKLIQDLLDNDIDIHYISNITGHGLRKIMRARGNFTYVLENIFDPQEIFIFIQKNAGLTDHEMYEEFNMGMDYAIFLPEKELFKAKNIIETHSFESINAGYLEKGARKVIIKKRNIVFEEQSLQLKA